MHVFCGVGAFLSVSTLGLGLLLVACSDDEADGSGGSDTSGAGAGATSSSSQSGTGVTVSSGSGTSCGEEPTVLLSGTFTDYLNMLPVIDAQVTSDSCPGKVYTTDDNGQVSAQVSSNVPFYPKIVAQSYATVRLGEQILVADYDASAELYPEALLSIVPTYTVDTPTLLAVVQAQNDATADCKDLSGYTFDVVGHPEAVVLYYGGSTIPQDDPTLTATGEFGLATISGLSQSAPGEFVQLTVEKAGCNPSFLSYPQTGNYKLENGVVTVAIAYEPPLLPP